MEENPNLLKIRDDDIISLEWLDEDDRFKINEGRPLSWIDSSNSPSKIDLLALRSGIEPWLTSLFQSEHLSLLVGTGLSYSLRNMVNMSGADSKTATTSDESSNEHTTDHETPMSLPNLTSEKYKEAILSSVNEIADKGHRGNANIEDAIRVINELLRGLEILGHSKFDSEPTPEYNAYIELKENLERIIYDFTRDITEMEKCIATAEPSKRDEAFRYLVNFLMSFASRAGTRDRLNIFTTNYDRVIEAGAELAGLHLLDRFTGTLAPIFRSSRLDIDMHYNPPGIRGEPRYLEGVARFTKLHGSIDWIYTASDIRRIGLPFGSEDLKNFLNAPGLSNIDCRNVMIYPNSAKDRETSEYPYVELFRDFAAALCRPNSTLVTYGYGFGDEHINRVIKDMLTIPSTHLVIISYDNAGGRIMRKFEELGRHSQITLIVGNHLANLKTLVDYFMPKPSIDKASIRMSELLKQRYSNIQREVPQEENSSTTLGGDQT